MRSSDQGRAESIRQRLRNRLRERGDDVQFGLQRYAVERFLYRLGESRHRSRLVLKGATLFALWGGALYRATRDLDFAGYGSTDQAEVLTTLREVCEHPSPSDEILFDAGTLAAEAIRDESEYHGLRVRFEGRLGASRIPVQIDIGFGNAIVPPAEEILFPTLLDDPAPRIRAYPLEAVIAEKLHAMAVLGERTSRLKDFYDLYVLARQFPFDGERFANAIAATFERRRTAIDAALPAALGPRFFADPAKAAQWRTYLDRNGLPGAPVDFDAVGDLLRAYLGPVWSALAAKEVFGSTWGPGGPWGREASATEPARSISGQARVAVRSSQVATWENRAASAPSAGSSEGSPRRFKRYPAYKNSGVEWLGEIPAHWDVRRLKHLASLNPESLSEDTAPDFDMVYVDIGSVDSLGRISAKERLTFSAAPSRARRTVRDGDVIVSTVRTYLRAIALIADPEPNMVVSTGFAVVRPVADISTDFAAYALRAPYFVERVVANSKGVSFPAINESEMATYRLAVPSSEEQHTIASFLDHETARIDALVAKKERLIELLEEKRSALITRAVTKGLDANVPMKDSGVEWLGEIPTHWEVTRLKHLLSGAIQNGLFKKKEHFGSGTLLVNVFDAYRDDFLIDEESLGRVEADVMERRAYAVESGDIVFVRSSLKLDGVGRSACVLGLSEPAVFECHLVRAQPEVKSIRPQYLIIVLNSALARQRLVALANTVTMSTLPQEAIGTLEVPVPPIREQDLLLSGAMKKLGRLGELIEEIRQGIERLGELRTALISDAVTGKIDVRSAFAEATADDGGGV